jgi:hypothetical protein
MAISRGPNLNRDGLVLYLDAANSKSYPGSGNTWKDLSGNDNNATLINGPTFDTQNSGNILFDGINDSFTIGETIDISNSNNKGNYTIFLDFILPGPLDPSNRRSFFVSSVGRQFEFSSTNVILISMLIDGLGGHQNIGLGKNLLLNEIQNLVITKTQTNTFTIWINGVLTRTLIPPYLAFRTDVGGDTYPVTTSTLFDTSIKSFGSVFNSRWWNGNVFRTLIYDRVLTPLEIIQNFNATRARFVL